MSEPVDIGTGQEKAFEFLQSRLSFSPLSPLREQGCLVLSPSAPLLVLAGDWAAAGSSGTVSGAIVSAYKAASLVAEQLKLMGETHADDKLGLPS